jgi:hypothetical protein
MNTKSEEFSPYTNDRAISLIRQDDGNWVGYISKFGKVVKVRQGDPTTVLQLLITHNGHVEET